jgi:hypothetical protein
MVMISANAALGAIHRLPPFFYLLSLSLSPRSAILPVQHFVSLAVLAMVSPVSHAIVNSCKRIVVIGLSVAYFRNPISPLNLFGMVCAFTGVYLYQKSVVSEKEVYLAPCPAGGQAGASGAVAAAGSLDADCDDEILGLTGGSKFTTIQSEEP